LRRSTEQSLGPSENAPSQNGTTRIIELEPSDIIVPAKQQSEKWTRRAIKFTNALAYQRWLVANGHRVENIFFGDDGTYTIIYRTDESEIPPPRIKSKRVLSTKYARWWVLSVVAIGLMLVIAAVVADAALVVADAALNAAGSGSTTITRQLNLP
jgi:hypothetical protein